MKDILEIVISKGRLAQWIICGGGVLLCIIGGVDGFLSGDDIVQIFLALMAATFALNKRGG